jgi:hypothetical protein
MRPFVSERTLLLRQAVFIVLLVVVAIGGAVYWAPRGQWLLAAVFLALLGPAALSWSALVMQARMAAQKSIRDAFTRRVPR